MDFLGLAGKTVVVFGLANKKSVACAIGRVLVEAGARVIHVVRKRTAGRNRGQAFSPVAGFFCCDVEDEANILRVRDAIAEQVSDPIDGIVHSIAFCQLR